MFGKHRAILTETPRPLHLCGLFDWCGFTGFPVEQRIHLRPINRHIADGQRTRIAPVLPKHLRETRRRAFQWMETQPDRPPPSSCANACSNFKGITLEGPLHPLHTDLFLIAIPNAPPNLLSHCTFEKHRVIPIEIHSLHLKRETEPRCEFNIYVLLLIVIGSADAVIVSLIKQHQSSHKKRR